MIQDQTTSTNINQQIVGRTARQSTSDCTNSTITSDQITDKNDQTTNLHFNHNDIRIRNVMYSRVTTKGGVRKVLVRLPYGKNGKWKTTYTALPISDRGNGKMWSKGNGGTIPMDFPANIMMYKGTVVAIEIKPFEHASDIVEYQETMSDNVRLLTEHVKKLRSENVEVFADLNGVYWKSSNRQNTLLTADTELQGVEMSNIAFNDFNATPETALVPKSKYSIQYQHKVKKHLVAITTPIFSNKIGLGNKYNKTVDSDIPEIDLDNNEKNQESCPIDMLNSNFRINLRFMIRASMKLNKFVDNEELDRVFGTYETLMELGVLSFMVLPDATLDKYTIRLSVKDCIIWLLGLQTRFSNESIENLEIIRMLIKFLLTKSLTKKGQTNIKNLYKPGKSEEDVRNMSSQPSVLI